ncbi:kinesin-like protein KIN-7D, mitochondrial isoform X2 [Drosophila subobscura]|nr:kinesin-like protein KIN-7D, mitochondrial isoform X2 [Drosophila subobscura]
MLGDDQNPGVIELATKEVFETIGNDKERSFLLRLQFIEVNNKIISDLIRKRQTEVQITDTGNGNVKENSEEYLVSSKEELMQWLSLGKKSAPSARTPYFALSSSRAPLVLNRMIQSCKAFSIWWIWLDVAT